MRILTALVVAVAASVAVAGGTAALADHLERALGPSEPARDFPPGFEPPVDSQAFSTLSPWKDTRVGGWGGGTEPCPAGHVARRPVVLVHGNSMDASFWRTADSGDGTIVDVRRKFLEAGYCASEVWGISYTGGAGYTTYNDVNVEDVYAFIQEVREFTGAPAVDVVAHSLGVTLVRKVGFVHRDLYDHLGAFVAIAGANRGTTSCRGSGTAHVSHVCEETEPGSAWLGELNSIGDTPVGPRYLTISDGSGLADTFYVGPDAKSPHLSGACNHEMPFTAHNTLARGAVAVGRFIAFLRDGALPACAQP